MRRNLHGISSWWRCQDFCGWISAVVLHLLEGIPLAKANQVSGACYIYLVTRKYAQFKSLNRWKEWVGPKAIFYLNRNLKKPIGLKGFSEWSQKWPPPPDGKTASKVHFRISGGGIFFKIMYVYSHGYKTQPVLRMNLLSTIFRLSICITLCPGPGRI